MSANKQNTGFLPILRSFSRIPCKGFWLRGVNGLVALGRRRIEINYWFGSLVLLAVLILLQGYLATLKGATEIEQTISLLASFSGMVVWVLLGLFLDGFVSIRYPLAGRLIFGLGGGVVIGLMWLDLQLFSIMKIHLLRAAIMAVNGGWQEFVRSTSAIGLGVRDLLQCMDYPLWGGLAGMVLLPFTRKICTFAPMRPRITCALAGVLALAGIQFVSQVTSINRIHPEMRLTVLNSMPLLNPGNWAFKDIARIPFELSPLERSSTLKVSNEIKATAENRIIVVMVVESLRADAVTPETMPHLSALQKESLPIRRAVSAGNATQLGWFALLTGKSSLRFRDTSLNEMEWGSVPFRLLKQLGYSVNVFNSLGQGFHKMDQIPFGKDCEMADVLIDTKDLGGGEFLREVDVSQRDVATTGMLLDILGGAEARKGQCNLIFLNSSHHPYFFPRGYPVPNPDYAKEEWDYSTLAKDAAQISLVKNKYLNSLHFVDSQIGRVLDYLRSKGLMEEAIVAVVGDHGEEFLETGKLFHNGEINRYQTEIPMIVKLPRGKSVVREIPIAGSADLFPTLLDAIGAWDPLRGYCDGESLLLEKHNPVFTAAANGAGSPNSFGVVTTTRTTYYQFHPVDAPIWSRKEAWLKRTEEVEHSKVPVVEIARSSLVSGWVHR